MLAVVAVLAAATLDRLLGDPQRWLHPVQLMGTAITALRRPAERWAGDAQARLRLAGLLICLLLVAGSAGAGWAIERLCLALLAAVSPLQPRGLPPLGPLVAGLLLTIALASALAGGSLARAVRDVAAALPDLAEARARLAWIVGRDVAGLSEPEILRAAAETAAENAVDGLFAPLFWMLLGAALWQLPGTAQGLPAGSALPGPLALAWAFKAASTLDSMLGYRTGRLTWLGRAGARLDDRLTWLPCRLVALSLPLAAGRPGRCLSGLRAALIEGAPDPSPTAGVSQAAYALAAAVRLGGVNHYGGVARAKPLLAPQHPAPDGAALERILRLSDRLELLWLLLWLLAFGGAAWQTTLQNSGP
ncbi:MAG: adenosylcobinamide-phosphate synthase CbiB [Synechococcaceae cyanobacterium]|nr:adenosylcobinamide-phosphate synthase CbiB [Synechococcaceae cyanobacterium]